MKMLFISKGPRSHIDPSGRFAAALRRMGSLTILTNGGEMSEAVLLQRMREADILLTHWSAVPIPAALADDPGRVRYILNLGGMCRPTVPMAIIRAGIPVTNWGTAPAHAVAEGAMTLLLAVLKDLRARTKALEVGRCGGLRDMGLAPGTLEGLRIGLYGCGVIGRKFVEMVRPFRPLLLVFDPYAQRLPRRCRRVDSLQALFERSEAIVILAGLNEQTRGSVTAELLRRLPDHAVVVNVARGAIIDQEALFAELRSGRLRAGLDVLVDDDYLPPGHEAHQWPNLILTTHNIATSVWPPRRTQQLSAAERIALDNLRRFFAGKPLRFLVDEERYLLSS